MEAREFKESELIASQKCGSVRMDIHHYQTEKPTVRDWWRVTITTFGEDNTYLIFDDLDKVTTFVSDLRFAINKVVDKL